MVLYAHDKEALLYDVINLETGLKIEHCLFANDETGDYEIYVCDEENNPIFSGQDYLTEKRKGNIKIIKKEIIMGRKNNKYSIKFITYTEYADVSLSPASLKIVIPQRNKFCVDKKVRVFIEEV
jgi:hypothetical protein